MKISYIPYIPKKNLLTAQRLPGVEAEHFAPLHLADLRGVVDVHAGVDAGSVEVPPDKVGLGGIIILHPVVSSSGRHNNHTHTHNGGLLRSFNQTK